MQVTAQMVKELREMTGAGMTDCKKALDEAQGVIEKAVVLLREKGLAAAAKKADRIASEGVIKACSNANQSKGFIYEVNCETDFVTRNEEFQAFIENLNKLVCTKEPTSFDALLSLSYDSSSTVGEKANSLIAKIGEKITVRQLLTLGGNGSYVSCYTHGNGKVAVLVEFTGTDISKCASQSEFVELSKDVAMQVAAMKPLYVSSDVIPATDLEKEKDIIRNKFLNQGKPENVIAKIIPSSVQSWFKEICLSEQSFLKDESKTVAAIVSECGKKFGVTNLSLKNFLRVELGQGIEKKADNFAEEVAAQVAAATRQN